MKKTLLLFALVGLVSCVSDDDPEELRSGQYIGRAQDVVVSMTLSDGSCQMLTVFEKSVARFQSRAVETSGSFPKYVYRFKDWTMTTSATGSDHFEASASGTLEATMGSGEILLPSSMSFSLSSEILDANGDGLLDR